MIAARVQDERNVMPSILTALWQAFGGRLVCNLAGLLVSSRLSSLTAQHGLDVALRRTNTVGIQPFMLCSIGLLYVHAPEAQKPKWHKGHYSDCSG